MRVESISFGDTGPDVTYATLVSDIVDSFEYAGYENAKGFVPGPFLILCQNAVIELRQTLTDRRVGSQKDIF